MLKLTLQIKPAPQAMRPVEAWYLAGDTPQAWVNALCGEGIPQTALKIYIVPRAADDLSPAGILVAGVTNSTTLPPSAIPYGRAGARLYLPIDAVLDPPMTDEELTTACLYPVMFWHPVIGLTGFDSEHALSLADMIAPPVWRDDDWSAAHPGTPDSPSLTAIALRLPPSELDQFFDEASKDIGSDPIKDLPPSLREPSDSIVDKLRRGVTGGILRGVTGMVGMFPATSLTPTWLNSLENWAGKHLQGLSDELDRTRNKELLRLLDLLKNDPEAGLRHAIPLGGLGAARGQAPPSSRLGSRNINFDMRRLGGGGAVDFWNVPGDWQFELRQHYQRLANREMSLGRYRRAAYIYAELLADVSGAAAALKQGKFFAEAAALYRDKLFRPLEAAQCLAAGGFYKEALAIYEQQQNHLEAAKMHRLLGDTAAAEQCIRHAVNKHQASGDYLAAAALLEQELGLTDEALDMLDTAWPGSQQAVRCKQKWFHKLGELGRHAKTNTALREMRREQFSADQTAKLSEVLLELFEHYPDHTARHASADILRIHISRQLANRNSPYVPAFVQHLKKLAPEDKLLVRDGGRFLADNTPGLKLVKRSLPPPIPSQPPAFVKEFSLPQHVTWSEAHTCGKIVYFLGHEQKHLHCLRGVWDGVYQGSSWNAPPDRPIPFAILANDRMEAIMGPILDTRLTPKYFPSNNRFGMNASEAGTPSWLPDQVMALAATHDTVWVLRWENSRFVLASHRANGDLIQQADLTNEISGALMATAKSVPPKMVVLAQQIIVAIGQHILIWRSDLPLAVVECESPITNLTASSPFARPFVLVECERSVELLWLEKHELSNVANDVQDPKCALTSEGQVILIAGSEGRVYQPSKQAIRRASSFPWPQGLPVTLVSAGQPGYFATLASNGKVSIFNIAPANA